MSRIVRLLTCPFSDLKVRALDIRGLPRKIKPMRSMAWEHAKGEIAGILGVFGSDLTLEEWQELDRLVDEFIGKFADLLALTKEER